MWQLFLHLALCKLDTPCFRALHRILMLIGSIYSAVVATIARFPYVQDLATLDSLFSKPDLAIWSQIEIGIALIASSAATFRPLLTKCKYWAYPRHRPELG